MCRLKWHSLGPRFVWRFVTFMGTYLLVLGGVSFGLGLKLMEYAERPDLTPVIAGLPTLVAGILGLFVRLGKRKWTITCFTIACVISGVLSVHMVYRFIGKEIRNLEVYDQRCRSEKHDSLYHCHLHAGTIILSIIAALMIPIAPAGLIIHFSAKRILQDKDCYIICCDSEKNIEPLQEVITAPTPQKHYLVRKTKEPVGRYTSSTSINDISSDTKGTNLNKEELDYLPIIPNFKDLAKADIKDDFVYTAKKTYTQAAKKKTSLEQERDFLHKYNVGEQPAANSKSDPEIAQSASIEKEFDFITGNDLYLYKSQEELRMGYLDETVPKRRRATGVSDEHDIERKSSLVNENAHKENSQEGEYNLGYSTIKKNDIKADIHQSRESDNIKSHSEPFLNRGNEKCEMDEHSAADAQQVKSEGSSPLRVRRGVNLTVDCKSCGLNDFEIGWQNVPIYNTDYRDEKNTSHQPVAKGLNGGNKPDEHVKSLFKDLGIDKLFLQNSPKPTSDVSNLWTPDHVTPNGKLSFIGLEINSSTRNEGDRQESIADIMKDQEGSRNHTPTRPQSTGSINTFGNIKTPTYGQEQKTYNSVDDLFSENAKTWMKVRPDIGNRNTERKSLTKEELDELLPYIM